MSMTKLLRAALRILRRPDLAPDAKRFEVDCPYATTGLTLLPRPDLHMTDGVMVIIAATAHEERCGRCDLSGVLDQGDQAFREQADRLWGEVCAAVVRGRRN